MSRVRSPVRPAHGAGVARGQPNEGTGKPASGAIGPLASVRRPAAAAPAIPARPKRSRKAARPAVPTEALRARTTATYVKNVKLPVAQRRVVASVGKTRVLGPAEGRSVRGSEAAAAAIRAEATATA